MTEALWLIVAILLGFNVLLALDNRRLRDELSEARKNDKRDPKTGRFVGQSKP